MKALPKDQMVKIKQTTNSRQLDAWFSIIACFSLQILSGTFLQPAVQSSTILSCSDLTLYFVFPILPMLLPVFYLSFKYGRVRFSDFFMHGTDYMVLLVALFVLFVLISFVVFWGPYRSFSLGGVRIPQLPLLEYSIVLLLILLIGPFLEEVLFRKYIFEIFRKRFGILMAVLLTSFSESFLHLGYGDIKGLFFVFVLSVFFTMIYFKSTLGASLIIHSLTNTMLYFVAWR